MTEILHSPSWQTQGAGATASAASPVRAHARTHRQHGSIGLISSVVGWDGAMRAPPPPLPPVLTGHAASLTPY